MKEVARRTETWGLAWIVTLLCLVVSAEEDVTKRAYMDNSIDSYFSERTCWWNEVCKREFQVRFRCRCPRWSFCRSPGRYYDAHCSITRTGYIWLQNEPDPDD
ncbi:unnamed protein product [Larinioides sclopetarius]|uniref:Uncharacterized protein n=1 Tax=Larinioides sclopetarius TaxID=280406 RepID=A0AAV1ZGP4_9ARAC